MFLTACCAYTTSSAAAVVWSGNKKGSAKHVKIPSTPATKILNIRSLPLNFLVLILLESHQPGADERNRSQTPACFFFPSLDVTAFVSEPPEYMAFLFYYFGLTVCVCRSHFWHHPPMAKVTLGQCWDVGVDGAGECSPPSKKVPRTQVFVWSRLFQT